MYKVSPVIRDFPSLVSLFFNSWKRPTITAMALDPRPVWIKKRKQDHCSIITSLGVHHMKNKHLEHNILGLKLGKIK